LTHIAHKRLVATLESLLSEKLVSQSLRSNSNLYRYVEAALRSAAAEEKAAALALAAGRVVCSFE
jgi:hypothetical protein